jgi:hypothetical protein
MIQFTSGQMNRQFSKDEPQMAGKYMRCLMSLSIKEMQIKATLSPTCPVRMAIIKKTNDRKCWERMLGERNPHTLLVGM